MLKFSPALQSQIAEMSFKLWTTVGMRWGLPLSRTAATVEVTAPWLFCTLCYSGKIRGFYLFNNDMTVSHPKLPSNSSFPNEEITLFKYSHPLPLHYLSAMTNTSVLPVPTTAFQNWDVYPSFLTIPAVFHASPAAPKNNTIPDSAAPKGALSTLLSYRAAAQ